MSKGPGDGGEVDCEHQHLLALVLAQAQMELGRVSIN